MVEEPKVMIWIRIHNMLHCVPVLVPLRMLLLHSQHILSQNEMRLGSVSCMLKNKKQNKPKPYSGMLGIAAE